MPLIRVVIAALLAVALCAPGAGAQGKPQPGSPEYFQRDNQNMQDAYGREFAPGGQVGNPAYTQAAIQEHGEVLWQQIGQQLATPLRLPSRRATSSRAGTAATRCGAAGRAGAGSA